MHSRVARLLLVVLSFTFVGGLIPTSAGADSANSRWLEDTYRDVFGRAADPGGLDFWLGRLAAGGDRSRRTVVTAMLFSPEGAGNEVERAYVDILGRSAEPGGRAYWTSFLQSGDVLVLRALLLASDEIFLRAGSEAAWIDEVYLQMLGRRSDPTGLAYWQGLLARGLPRQSLVGAIYRSDEGLGSRVDQYYREVLGRGPTADERLIGIAAIRSADERRFRAQMLSLDEAFEPFVAGQS